MNTDPRHRRATLFGMIGLAFPLGIILLIILMRMNVFTFHDDFHGFKGLSFFLIWGFILLPTGLLCSAIAIGLKRDCLPAIGGLVISAVMLLLALVNMV